MNQPRHFSPEKRARLLKTLFEKGSSKTEVESIRRRSNLGLAPLSFAQQRLWFIDQLEPGSAIYHITSAMRLKGDLQTPVLEQMFSEIVRRHEALRTGFPTVDGSPVQRIAEAGPLPLLLVDLSGLNPEARSRTAERLGREEAVRPFDLTHGSLLRTVLIRQGVDRHLALQTMHHIISDAWSIDILNSEVRRLHRAYSEGRPSPLEELPIQYADYAEWQRQWLAGERLGHQLAYWKEELRGATQALELPTDHPRPSVKTYRGGSQPLNLPAELTLSLKELGRSYGATLFMTLLAGFKVLLARYS